MVSISVSKSEEEDQESSGIYKLDAEDYEDYDDGNECMKGNIMLNKKPSHHVASKSTMPKSDPLLISKEEQKKYYGHMRNIPHY